MHWSFLCQSHFFQPWIGSKNISKTNWVELVKQSNAFSINEWQINHPTTETKFYKLWLPSGVALEPVSLRKFNWNPLIQSHNRIIPLDSHFHHIYMLYTLYSLWANFIHPLFRTSFRYKQEFEIAEIMQIWLLLECNTRMTATFLINLDMDIGYILLCRHNS